MALSDALFWFILIAFVVLFWFVPQWLNRRRQQQRIEALSVGDRVLTIGGFVGTLTHFDPEAGAARIRLTEDVEVEILPGAIRGQYRDDAGEAEAAD